MKKIFIMLTIAGFTLLGTSCGGGGDDPVTPTPTPTPTTDPTPTPTPSPTYPTYESPSWSVSNRQVFEYTMVASVAIPDSLSSVETTSDKVAVFVQSECRGVAERIETANGKHVWMSMIYFNTAGEPLTFKYYNASNKHMYVTTTSVPTSTDGSYGSVDAPQTLSLSIVTQ